MCAWTVKVYRFQCWFAVYGCLGFFSELQLVFLTIYRPWARSEILPQQRNDDVRAAPEISGSAVTSH